MVRLIGEHRNDQSPFEVVIGGETAGDDRKDMEIIGPIFEAGATWWIEGLHPGRGPFAAMRERLRKGPPGRGHL